MGWTWSNLGKRPTVENAQDLGNVLGDFRSKMNVTKLQITQREGAYNGWCDKECATRGNSIISGSVVSKLQNISSCNTRKIKAQDLLDVRSEMDKIENDTQIRKEVGDPRNKCFAKNYPDTFTECSDYGYVDNSTPSETEFRTNSKHECSLYFSTNLTNQKDTRRDSQNNTYKNDRDVSIWGNAYVPRYYCSNECASYKR